jgi:protein-S-isoprenylcysteine O-methyltransferase Ste14
VAGLVPWWLTGYRLTPAPPWLLGLRVGVGGLLVLAGLAVLVRAFVRFVAEGHGTPAPVAPPETLVVGGDYRYVRNPMYVAVVTCLVGQAVIVGSLKLDVYTVLVWLAMAAFVRWYEEPALLARFGPSYSTYRRAVRAWVPRVHPWTAPKP